MKRNLRWNVTFAYSSLPSIMHPLLDMFAAPSFSPVNLSTQPLLFLSSAPLHSTLKTRISHQNFPNHHIIWVLIALRWLEVPPITKPPFNPLHPLHQLLTIQLFNWWPDELVHRHNFLCLALRSAPLWDSAIARQTPLPKLSGTNSQKISTISLILPVPDLDLVRPRQFKLEWPLSNITPEALTNLENMHAFKFFNWKRIKWEIQFNFKLNRISHLVSLFRWDGICNTSRLKRPS